MKKENNIGKILGGGIFGDPRIIKALPFALFLTGIAMIAIRCSHSADKKVVEINELRNEMKELEAEHRESQNKLMELGMESKVLEKAQKIGLEESKTPPKKIVITNE